MAMLLGLDRCQCHWLDSWHLDFKQKCGFFGLVGMLGGLADVPGTGSLAIASLVIGKARLQAINKATFLCNFTWCMIISLKPCTVMKEVCLQPKFGSDCTHLIIHKWIGMILLIQLTDILTEKMNGHIEKMAPRTTTAEGGRTSSSYSPASCRSSSWGRGSSWHSKLNCKTQLLPRLMSWLHQKHHQNPADQ